MELHQLECLVTVAEAGTISKAAEILMFSQPALTRAIQNLEDELGYPLFDWVKNRLKLNDTGELAVKYARKVLEDKDLMLKNLAAYQKNKQCISIGACAPAPLWGLKQIFLKQYPDIKINSTISEDNIELIEAFNNHAFSILILDYPINEKNIISTKLFSETLYIAVRPDDPLSHYKSITFEQLNGTNILLLSKTGYWSEICNEKLSESLMLVQEDIDAYNALLKASSLPTFRTNITIPKFKKIEDRVYIAISDKEATLSFYAIYNKNDHDRYSIIENEIRNVPWHLYRNEESF